jgi:hypothetical protein
MPPTSYTTASTVWPTAVPIPIPIQRLIARFYELADLNSPDAGDRFATEVFTPTGFMAGVGGHGFHGEKGMYVLGGGRISTAPVQINARKSMCWQRFGLRASMPGTLSRLVGTRFSGCLLRMPLGSI